MFLFLKVAVKVTCEFEERSVLEDEDGVSQWQWWGQFRGAMCRTDGDMYRLNRVNMKIEQVEGLKRLFRWEDVDGWQMNSDF